MARLSEKHLITSINLKTAITRAETQRSKEIQRHMEDWILINPVNVWLC
jgi:hypothetical protein